MILGVNDGHDAGVAVVTPAGEILFAANEERYTGVKQQWGFPHLSLQHALDYLDLNPKQITAVAFGFRGLVETELSSFLPSDRVGPTRRLYTLATRFAGPLMATRAATRLIQLTSYAGRRNREVIAETFKRLGITAPRQFIAHHQAHAASAYYTSGFSEGATVITIDAGGDGLSGSLWRGRNGALELLDSLPRIHSLGDFWLAITHLCGFNPDRHGGKITGLAAYKECPEALAALKTLYEGEGEKFGVRNRRYLFWKRLVTEMGKVLEGFDREQIAWGAQRLLEELVVHLVEVGLEKAGNSRVAVAGGVFANVKLNLEILRLPGVDDFFVHPHMGDGGVAVGAALDVAARKYGALPRELRHVFLGTDAGDPEGLEALPEDAFTVEKGDLAFLAARTASLIKEGKVVGVVRGRMEYGPRALTNRSILYHPFDPSVMDWLNERLDRTEFMPFAPVVAEERAAEFFDLSDKGALPSRFMTVCLPSTERAQREAPAIVHIDGTARPQYVSRRETPYMYEVLEQFEKLTGVPVLINTSFNRHEQPIVATATQAREELERGVVDALVLDDRVVTANN